MRSDVEGSYEELEKELLEYLAMIDQQNRKATGEPQLRGRQSGSQRTKRSQFLRVHRALVG